MDSRKRGAVFTAPNLITLFRIGLIPLFVWLCILKDAAHPACAVLLISGASDIADGYIARRYGLVSDLGKILDPVADKLTQAAALICLTLENALLLLPLGLMLIKELFSGLLCFFAMQVSREVHSSHWHGKLNTALIYALMISQLMWPHMPDKLLLAFVLLCSSVMLLSFILYSLAAVRILSNKRRSG